MGGTGSEGTRTAAAARVGTWVVGWPLVAMVEADVE